MSETVDAVQSSLLFQITVPLVLGDSGGLILALGDGEKNEKIAPQARFFWCRAPPGTLKTPKNYEKIAKTS